MARARARLDWSCTSATVACLLNSFRGRRQRPIEADFLVPAALKTQPEPEPDPPVEMKLPVDALIDIFCKPEGR